MRVADEIANWLFEKKILTAFGIVGGGNVSIFDAIQAKGATRIVCTHHEQAAAMASTYHNRICGYLGSAVLCTTGAGSTNAITGVMAAFMDSIPLLVISGNDPWKSILTNTRVKGTQGFDSRLMAAQMTVHSEMALGDIRTHLERCWREALGLNANKRQGPAWLDMPKDRANATI